MSNELTPRAFRTKLGNAPAKSVLCLLADMSDPNGYSFPGDPYILMATELKKRTVDRSIEVLGRIALVKKMKVTGERHKTAYQINLEMLGRDLAAEFGAAFMAAQRKKSVSETQKSVSETSFSVSETKPLQPHSRGTAIEPSGNLLPDSAETVQPPSAADGESPSQPEQRAKATAKAKAPDQGKGKSKSNGKGKPEADPRHTPFRLAVMTYAKFKGVLFVWDGSEARALTTLLRSAPELTLQVFQTCLNNRAKSVGTPHGERPRLWLPHVLRYQQGPLNQFGKTEIPVREAAVGMDAAGAEFDDTAALSYWSAMRARGSAIYAKDAPAWVRDRLESDSQGA